MSGPFGSSQWMYKSEEYEVANSCAFSDGNQDYLKRTPGSASNRRTWTWSSWLKRSRNDETHMVFFTAVENDLTEDDHFGIRFDSGTANLIITWGDGNVGVSAATHHDSSAWFHLVVAIDTTQGTDTDRIKAYINGEAVTFGSTDLPSQNHQYGINKAQEHNIGSRKVYSDSANYFDGYMAEIHFVDGTQLTPSSFGETGTYGEWKPKEYAGAHGTNGFYLPFDDSSDLGDDESANTNDWTEVNISALNQVPDSPSNNFCTYQEEAGFGVRALTSSGRRYEPNGGAGYLFANMGMTTGKWYFEVCQVTAGNGYHTMIVSDFKAQTMGATLNAVDEGVYAVYSGTYFYSGEGDINLGYPSPGSNGDITSMAIDLDNNKLWVAKNGTWYNSGDPAAGSNQTQDMDGQVNKHVRIATTHPNASYTGRDQLNCGQDSSFSGAKTAQGNTDSNGIGDFFYTPPSGFLAICSKNLPKSSFAPIVPKNYFNTILYTGDDQTGKSITGVGFQPTFSWIKEMQGTAHHVLHDAARGATAGRISSNRTAVEDATDSMASFDSDGFTVGSSAAYINSDSANIVAWNWKGGGAGSSNTEGSINTTKTSADTDAGFSIMTYTGNATEGATIGHGLTKAPEVVMTKRRASSAGGWMVFHIGNTAAPETDELNLEVTEATQDSANIWNDTLPSNTVITLGNNAVINGNNDTFVAYAWHSVEGFSKFGSYVGTNSTDGAFVYLGFKPALVITKAASRTGHWNMQDNKNNPTNRVNKVIFANDSAAQYTDPNAACLIDFTSNGFKWRNNDDNNNDTGETYVYMAWAAVPAKFSNAY